MKKTLLCIIFALLLTVQGFADAIIEPENKFFNDNHDKCEFVSHTFKTIRDTDIYTKPNGAAVGVLEKGERVVIQYAYFDENGYCYGLYYDDELKVGEDLWINLGDTEIVYDQRIFYNQYSDSFKDATNEKDGLDFTKDMYIYTYPGSDSYIKHHFTSEPYHDKVFTDENGTKWLRLPAGWINTADPYNKTEPVERKVPDGYQPLSKPIKTEPLSKNGYVVNYVIAGALVLAACVTALLMIRKNYPKE